MMLPKPMRYADTMAVILADSQAGRFTDRLVRVRWKRSRPILQGLVICWQALLTTWNTSNSGYCGS